MTSRATAHRVQARVLWASRRGGRTAEPASPEAAAEGGSAEEAEAAGRARREDTRDDSSETGITSMGADEPPGPQQVGLRAVR